MSVTLSFHFQWESLLCPIFGAYQRLYDGKEKGPSGGCPSRRNLGNLVSF